jgi:hypothetical protein
LSVPGLESDQMVHSRVLLPRPLLNLANGLELSPILLIGLLWQGLCIVNIAQEASATSRTAAAIACIQIRSGSWASNARPKQHCLGVGDFLHKHIPPCLRTLATCLLESITVRKPMNMDTCLAGTVQQRLPVGYDDSVSPEAEL